MKNISDQNAPILEVVKKTYEVGGKKITFETGKLALLANGSVTISDETGNVLLVSVGIKEAGVNEEADFFPLVVDYQEKFYATGKIGGNRFQKREGRPSESSILTARLIDRPIRPMFPKGFINDTQIIATVFSSDGESDIGFYGITGASIGLMQAGAPFEGPVSGVKIVLTNEGKYELAQSFEQEKNAKMVLLVAGTLDAITMVESWASEVSEREMLGGLEYAHKLIKEICEAQKDFVAMCKKVYGETEIKSFYNLPDESLYGEVEKFLTEEKLEVLYGKGKKEFQYALDMLDDEVKDYLVQNNFVEILEGHSYEEVKASLTFVGGLVYKRVKAVMRKNVLENEKRLDLRKLDEVRPIA